MAETYTVELGRMAETNKMNQRMAETNKVEPERMAETEEVEPERMAETNEVEPEIMAETNEGETEIMAETNKVESERTAETNKVEPEIMAETNKVEPEIMAESKEVHIDFNEFETEKEKIHPLENTCTVYVQEEDVQIDIIELEGNYEPKLRELVELLRPLCSAKTSFLIAQHITFYKF